jgi:hypothetical protein
MPGNLLVMRLALPKADEFAGAAADHRALAPAFLWPVFSKTSAPRSNCDAVLILHVCVPTPCRSHERGGSQSAAGHSSSKSSMPCP